MAANGGLGGQLDLDQATQNLNTSDSSPTYKKPKHFIDAISEIQQFHVFEKEQEADINANFFTLRQVFDFITTGFKSGFVESLLFVMLLPFLQTIYPSFKEYFLGISYSPTE